MTPEQSRAARAWLGWSQVELAKRANVSLRTIQSFEKGETTPFPNNINAIRRVLEEAGLRFIFDTAGMGAGIFRYGAEIDVPDVLRRASGHTKS
jgi:predicted transcriptional regulator